MHMKPRGINFNWASVTLLFVLPIMVGCVQEVKELPIMGNHRVVSKVVNGEEVEETIYHSVEHYEFENQDGVLVSPATFKGKVYVADFFFTSCTTICPIMKSQMKRVYDAFEGNEQVAY